MHTDTLNPEYTLDESGMMPVLRHPLIVMPFTGDVTAANKILEVQRERARSYADDSNLAGFVWSHARPFRPEILWLHRDMADDNQVFSKLAIECWTDTEFPSDQDSLWDLIWSEVDPSTGCTPDDWAHLNRMGDSDHVELFRGGSRTGRSWTTDRSVAEFFANRFGDGKVHRLMIDPLQIVAYISGRGESECVLLEPARGN